MVVVFWVVGDVLDQRFVVVCVFDDLVYYVEVGCFVGFVYVVDFVWFVVFEYCVDVVREVFYVDLVVHLLAVVVDW